VQLGDTAECNSALRKNNSPLAFTMGKGTMPETKSREQEHAMGLTHENET
jgi:hypothetical protein